MTAALPTPTFEYARKIDPSPTQRTPPIMVNEFVLLGAPYLAFEMRDAMLAA